MINRTGAGAPQLLPCPQYLLAEVQVDHCLSTLDNHSIVAKHLQLSQGTEAEIRANFEHEEIYNMILDHLVAAPSMEIDA